MNTSSPSLPLAMVSNLIFREFTTPIKSILHTTSKVSLILFEKVALRFFLRLTRALVSL